MFESAFANIDKEDIFIAPPCREPLDRVPYGETVHRTISPTFLIFIFL